MILRQGMTGDAVRRWQAFLLGRGLCRIIDGEFGPLTAAGTAAFQRLRGLTGDGIVGPQTLAEAQSLGFVLAADDDSFPPRPAFPPLVSTADRQAIFGAFRYERTAGEAIRILDGWEAAHIVTVEIPQLRGVEGAPASGRVRFHERVAAQAVALFAAWEAAGLMPLVLTWAGSYTPRFVRGSRTVLSNHAFGSAFDINAAWNPLGVRPAARGAEGSTRELVPIANAHGWFWGGHFERPDSMHFEVAEVRG